MLMTAADTSMRFTLKIPNLQHDLQVLGFEGTEQISHPFAIKVRLVSERPTLALDSLLHKMAFLCFGPPNAGIHGQIHTIERGQTGKRLTHYNLTLVPRLAYLQYRVNQRIFQNLTVPDIIGRVLKEHAILPGDYCFSLGPATYPPREYCTQFDESDLNFIQRLCAEEGIHYHFEHRETGHVLVFGDDQAFFTRLAPNLYKPQTGLCAGEPGVSEFSVRLEARPTSVTRRDYQFKTPRVRFEPTYREHRSEDALPEPQLENYRYPGQSSGEVHGKQLSKRALEQLRSDYCLANGASNVPQLCSGYFLDLQEHPDPHCNRLWLLTQIIHQGEQPQVLEELAATGTGSQANWQGYRNTFQATPWDTFFRPANHHRKPYIHGSQSAVVTGPAGEEIHCDEYGRVKVQFHWDREAQGNDKSSCWLRVASNWAGTAYGSLVIPRVGMEVVVSFWEGCPDQPYISGCVINGRNTPPDSLPANKTRSVFKTLSTPGGGGGNELHIEDRKGAERIYVHAERNWDQKIKNDQIIAVGNERHETVTANSYTELQAEEHRTTRSNRVVRLGGSDHLEVTQSQQVKTGIGHYLDAGQEIHLKAGSKVVIEAGVELTLAAGGSTLTLNPGGIWLDGVRIMENNRGPTAQGSGYQGLAALLPGAASTSSAGKTPPPALANAQLNLMKTAAQAGESRCLICEACRENTCTLERPQP